MSEDLKAKARRYMEETYNKGNLDVLHEFCAASFVRHQPPAPDRVGIEAVKKYMADVRVSYPDFHGDIEEIIGEGNTTVTRGFWGGTQSGPSPSTGAPGSGKKVKVAFCTVYHWVNGQLAEEWELDDWLAFFQQLGYTPPQPKK